MIYQADIREVTALKQGKASLILTEPMWEVEYWPLWLEVVKFADRVLEEDGWLIASSAPEYLPYHSSLMVEGAEGTGMKYRWSIVRIGKNPETRLQEFTPMYCFSKGSPDWPYTEWAISQYGTRLDPYVDIIRAFTPKDGLVSDPFLGDGIVRRAAHIMMRPFEGSDIDPYWIDSG